MKMLFRLIPPALEAFTKACVFLIVILNPAGCVSIDEELIRGYTGLSAFDTFHVNHNLTIDIKADLDMLLPVEQFKKLYRPETSEYAEPSKRNAVDNYFSLWPNATIHYEIAENIRHGAEIIKDALNQWEKYTCIKFEERTHSSRIKFTHGSGCYSYVGYFRAVQEIVLQNWCLTRRIVVHEIGHSIGFVHQQSRPDRDFYIRVSQRNDYWMFRKYRSHVSSYGVPYDYLSIMHYGGFGIITTLDPTYQDRIGKSPGLSYGDIKQTNVIYNCVTLRSFCPDQSCPFNGLVFFKEFKGQPACECFCDSGDQNDPLVPCSSITKEVPGPNLVDTSSQVTEDPNPCFDLRPDCDSLKSQGLCIKEATRLMEQCTKTCEFCGIDKDLCIDNDPACKLMAASCADDSLKEIMSSLCRKTCKVCTEPTVMCYIQESGHKSQNLVKLQTWLNQ